ncbi:hypothetical protein HKD42_10545 [Altererythrobacter sp. RZ02]|uniref:Uncharacterized protein n=1 Tax=Pontixanthobacter rizhaonensis TaxID=2730337 RepID=A0A848QP72_9SPHN|nr:hypothetical protein [Pontixanthobacter rizhaonensis]NMW32500.1 hypothetical protein [Pontixanthobacter rizhaonensis]
MTNENAPTSGGHSPWFWAGLMLASYAIISALIVTKAIEQTPYLIFLILVPLGLTFPLMKAANRRVDDGSCLGKGEAQKRYIKRVAVSTSAYLAAFALMTFATASGDPPIALRAFLAILPGLAIIGIFWAIGRLIVEEQDEFMRMLIVRQSLVATGFALSAASIWGFLEAADVVPHLDAYWVAVAWFAGLGLGAIMNRVQYGTWGAV